MRMQPLCPVLFWLVFLFGCERKSAESSAVRRSSETEQKSISLDSLEKDAELALLKEELEQLRSRLRVFEDELVVEVKARLSLIESDHAEAVSLKNKRYNLLESLQKSQHKFSEKVRKEAQKNEELVKTVEALDPAFAFTDARSYVDQFKILLLEVSEDNQALRDELKALKAGE